MASCETRPPTIQTHLISHWNAVRDPRSLFDPWQCLAVTGLLVWGVLPLTIPYGVLGYLPALFLLVSIASIAVRTWDHRRQRVDGCADGPREAPRHGIRVTGTPLEVLRLESRMRHASGTRFRFTVWLSRGHLCALFATTMALGPLLFLMIEQSAWLTGVVCLTSSAVVVVSGVLERRCISLDGASLTIEYGLIRSPEKMQLGLAEAQIDIDFSRQSVVVCAAHSTVELPLCGMQRPHEFAAALCNAVLRSTSKEWGGLQRPRHSNAGEAK